MKIQNFKEFHSTDILREIRTYKTCSEILKVCHSNVPVLVSSKKAKDRLIPQNSCSWTPDQSKSSDPFLKNSSFLMEHSIIASLEGFHS